MEPAGETDLKNSVLARRLESNLNKNRSKGLQDAASLHSVLQTCNDMQQSKISSIFNTDPARW